MSKYPICNIQVQIRIKCTVKKAGYAYAPFQRLGKLYDPETAMRAGTVFPELNITLDEYERGLYNGV